MEYRVVGDPDFVYLSVITQLELIKKIFVKSDRPHKRN